MRISVYKCQRFQFTYKINDDESDDEIITTATSSSFAVSNIFIAASNSQKLCPMTKNINS